MSDTPTFRDIEVQGDEGSETWRVIEGHESQGVYHVTPIHAVKGLHPICQILYIWLWVHRDNKSGVCWPSTSRLAKSCGAAENSIRKYRKVLVQMGLITYVQRKAKNGVDMSPLYTVPAIVKVDKGSVKTGVQGVNPRVQEIEGEGAPVEHELNTLELKREGATPTPSKQPKQPKKALCTLEEAKA